MRAYGRLVLLLVASLLLAPAGRAADAVSRWTLEADELGNGNPNWRTLAIMQMAVHDALNAITPRYVRWAPAQADEPPAEGALPEAAAAAAAAEVLRELHPAQLRRTENTLNLALISLPSGAALERGLALGRAIGAAAVARRAGDGGDRIRPLPVSDTPGRWRATPPDEQVGTTSDIVPFLFPRRDSVPFEPPPALGGEVYLRVVAEVRRIGALASPERTEEESYAARYWAAQNSQRGFVRLAVQLLDARPLPGGLIEHARVLSELTAALADSAILSWVEKEHFSYWRPITAIHSGAFGVAADPTWTPYIPTPPHPDYPSGHAADCYTGAAVLRAAFGPQLGPVTYVAQSGMAEVYKPAGAGMGVHPLIGGLGPVERAFPSVEAAARECSLSRIWAGVHFRTADDEAERLAGVIAAAALARLPAVAPAP